METLFELYKANEVEILRLVIFITAFLPFILAVIQHFRLKKAGLTPARIFLTLLSFIAAFFIMGLYPSDEIMFKFIDKSSIAFNCCIQIFIAFLIPFIYKVNRKKLRIVFSVISPILLVLFLMANLMGDFFAGPLIAKNFNEQFALLSQEDKNKYYTNEDLERATGIKFPDFDVVSYKITREGPDSGFEYILKFRESLPKDVMDQLHLDENGVYHVSFDPVWGDGITIYPYKRKVRIYCECH